MSGCPRPGSLERCRAWIDCMAVCVLRAMPRKGYRHGLVATNFQSLVGVVGLPYAQDGALCSLAQLGDPRTREALGHRAMSRCWNAVGRDDNWRTDWLVPL